MITQDTEIPDVDEQRPRLSQRQAQTIQTTLAELKKRATETLELFVPFPKQLEFMQSQARMKLVRGGNRSAKTTIVLIEIALLLLDKHPYLKLPEGPIRAYLVGKNENHLGEVLFRKLFRPGAIRLIRDLGTGKLRSYYWAVDRGREAELVPAPPIIPARMVKSVSWRKAKDQVPRMARLTNDREILFLSGNGRPPQGMDVDIVLFDEEITGMDWLPEMQQRLIDRKGRFYWSCTPQDGTEQLYQLSEQANNPDYKDERGEFLIHETIIKSTDNPHIDQEEVRMKAALMSPAMRRVRVDGEFAAAEFFMFSEFAPGAPGRPEIHGIDRGHLPKRQIPLDWCRYVAIDPGYSIAAALFAAVPPPGTQFFAPDTFVIYDEIYIPKCNPDMFAKAMREKTEGTSIRTFIIDEHMGRARSAQTGKTTKQQYSEALKRYNVASETTGNGFLPGFDDVLAGCGLIRDSLRIRADGSTRMKVLVEMCPNFIKEMTKLRRKRSKGESGTYYEDTPAPRQNDHTVDCARYLCGHGMPYAIPRDVVTPRSKAARRLENKERRMRRRFGGSSIILGPRPRHGATY